MPRIEAGRRSGGNRRAALSQNAVGLLGRIADYELRHQRMPLVADVVDISVGSIKTLSVLIRRGFACVIDGQRLRVTRPGWQLLRSRRA